MKLIEIYLAKGLSQEEAEQKVKEIKEKRSCGLKRVWKERGFEIVAARTPKIVAKTTGQKRSKEQKKTMSNSAVISREKIKRETPDLWRERYEKSSITSTNKSTEEKEQIKKNKSIALKKMWKEFKGSAKEIERNKNISKSSMNKVRTEESKQKQAKTNTGKKFSKETLEKRAINREAKAARGESMGLRCKMYSVGGLHCQGGSEKAYIEKLIKEGVSLPTNAKHIMTPTGAYHPDFEYNDRFIEVKSEYTYKIFNGMSVNMDNKISLNQKEKALWVSRNVKPVEVIVINNKGVVVKSETL